MLIKGNYSNIDLISDNFYRICLCSVKEKLDLSNADHRQKVEDTLKDFDLLVLDNLGKLFSSYNEQNEKGWKEIYDWIRSLNEKGKAVLLVHHKNKDGVLRGTSKISHDADVIISLSKPSKKNDALSIKGTKVEVHIVKGRNLKSDEKEPFTLVYNEENGHLKCSILSLDGSPIENEDFVTEEEIKEFDLDELDIDILHKARNPDVEFVKAGDFKDESTDGRSGTTVTDHLNKLVKLELLERTGEKKGTKYKAARKKVPPEE